MMMTIRREIIRSEVGDGIGSTPHRMDQKLPHRPVKSVVADMKSDASIPNQNTRNVGEERTTLDGAFSVYQGQVAKQAVL
jgi:hypothetical protein